MQDKLDFLGYLTCHTKIESETYDPVYMKFYMEFRNPITEKVMKDLETLAKECVEHMGIVPTKVSFVTEEECLKNLSDNPISFKWDDRKENEKS